MVDINRHRFYLVQILKDIYTDIELANYLGFKGGSALMFFYDLPRFSIDLDFSLIDVEKEDFSYRKVRQILLKYGKIFDEAKKFYGHLIVLDYGINERKLKVEISNRLFENRYEIKNLLGINMKVMVQEDMFAHKLCALLDRNAIESRMGMFLSQYLQACIDHLEGMSDKGLLQGIGELLDSKMKKFVQVKMRSELITLLKFYKDYPVL
jgi:hypothetical protein